MGSGARGPRFGAEARGSEDRIADRGSRGRSYELAVQFYGLAKGVEIPGHLKDQLLRAASSVALNLSEGTGRKTMPDQSRFFHIAMGSIRECQAVVELESEAFGEAAADALDHLAASTYKLIRGTPS